MKLHYFNVPLQADSAASPRVSYGGGLNAINFLTSDERWGRVTFEKLDSLRICRGEYEPYPRDLSSEAHSWVSFVSDSHWLSERYEYEKRYYGRTYEFGGKVEEMLSDYSHWVFAFHDQFVEALSAGIWFESADTNLGSQEPNDDHPLRNLPESAINERFQAHGITCQVRRNPLSSEELMENANFCSQMILQVAAELDGRANPDWTLSLRVRDGHSKISFRNHFGKEVQCFDSIPTLESLRPRIDKWLGEVRQRRVKMGKA
jgi:hypothetical protein